MNRTLDPTEILLSRPDALTVRVRQAVAERFVSESPYSTAALNSPGASSVLLLLGLAPNDKGPGVEPCVILNKRSEKVKQPGDLCCPGGSIAPRLDVFLSKLIRLPGTPLARWDQWAAWRRRRPQQAFILALLLAAGLREGFEEMRLNPFGLHFLGPLPAERLVMFQRVIYPLIGWIPRQRRFRLNWEVERVVNLPLRRLLDPSNYARYRLHIDVGGAGPRRRQIREFPSFLHTDGGHSDRLWGATFRIVMAFLKLVFGFRVPDMHRMPVVEGTLNRRYLTGSGETPAAVARVR
jgi:hypothetical protein